MRPDPEEPEADVLEQEQGVGDDEDNRDADPAALRPPDDPEVPVDDALEQQQVVPVDDDRRSTGADEEPVGYDEP